MSLIIETNLPELTLLHRGKVRDTYDLGGRLLLMVATDRISAFDVLLPTSIPEKGVVLCQMSAFWFRKTAAIVPNHLVHLPTPVDLLIWTDAGVSVEQAQKLAPRAMVVRRAHHINVECIARGYITGSTWAEYQRYGTVAGQPMPSGFKEGDKFAEPLFTPTTKAETGHDQNLTIQQMEDMLGKELTFQLAEITLHVYRFAHIVAMKRGIIIADTKMEFGMIEGCLSLIDELLTPDSSRFWDAAGYAPGKSQPNFDKQFVRDWLNAQGWNHEPPAPELPSDVVEKTRQRYIQAYQRLTGKKLV